MKNKLFVKVGCCIFSIGLLAGCGSTKTNLLDNPKDADVEKAIEKIDGVKSICVATEDNDPNGNLNKEGYYTGAVFFRLQQVDERVALEEYSTPFGDNACDVGTQGGGQIEIYANEDDAKKRNEYLSEFDGSVLGDFHKVRGTVIIRLSNSLSATQQKDIEKQIYNELNKEREK